jgi:hypothetical protein
MSSRLKGIASAPSTRHVIKVMINLQTEDHNPASVRQREIYVMRADDQAAAPTFHQLRQCWELSAD